MTSLIIFLSCFLAFFGALVLLSIRHGNRKTNMWLALFCIGVSGYLLRGYLLLSEYYIRFPLVTELLDNSRYFMSPALYFYIRTAADSRFQLRKYDLLHLVPLALNLVVTFPFYLIDSAQQALRLTQWLHGSLKEPAFLWVNASRIVFFVYYFYFTFLSIRHYLKTRKQIEQASLFGRIYSSWIALFILTVISVFLLWFWCAALLISGRSYLFVYDIIYLFIACMVFLCIFILFLRPEILYRAKALKSDKKYPASYLSNGEADRHFTRLLDFMRKEEEYLNPDLDLQSLAEKLSITKNYLSQIINEKTGKTFNDFVNGYRIEKVKAFMADPRRKEATILDLAFEAGFNSKTPFNNAFKKHTGESPTVYRKNHLEP